MAQTSTLETALARARALLSADPALAARQAEAILETVPDHPAALFVLGAARRRLGVYDAARSVLEPLAAAQPHAPAVHLEWALTQAALDRLRPAIGSLQHAVSLKPELPGAWRLLGDWLHRLGDRTEADAAYACHVEQAVHDPALMQAGRALAQGELPQAEAGLRARLGEQPTDVAALRMLAELGTRLGRDAEAQSMLETCLELMPSFTAARHNLAVVLFRQNRAEDALVHLDQLLGKDPHNPNYRSLEAACLALIAEYDRAVEIYERLLAEHPQQPKVWLSYGHALKTAGHRPRAIAAYRAAAAQNPSLGEAYWSLANMKSAAFAAEEVEVARRQLERPDLSVEDRYHFHYTLGYVLEQAGDYADSFKHYAEGARLRRSEIDYDAAQTTMRLQRIRSLMTAAFFAEREGLGCMDEAPIFIVGLPRSGSTLIEQILSSHSEVEGTLELPTIIDLAHELGRRGSGEDFYPAVLADLSPDTFADLGACFLKRTRIYRKTSRPIFIDKMPNNFVHVGMIHLILPRARIIDARRGAMAACFSAFKQHFARGQHFSYDLRELGLYYRDYVALMDHFDGVLPGCVHRVQYETTVEDLEGQTRRLLDACRLDFQPACLRFHENTRAVRTASSEQVRQPIYRDGLDQWRRYAPWLSRLESALAEPEDADA
jgi:tetratricopeptide (TPR) repeat protein